MSRPITPDSVYDLVSVSSPSLSPDGGKLAFARSHADKTDMKTRSGVFMADLAGGGCVRFTAGDNDSNPRFSPDGKRVAFVRPDARDRAQIWVIPADGGEARRLTDVPGGINDLAWSPDSSALAFASDVDPDRAPDDHDPKIPRVKIARRIRYRADGLGWRGDAFRRIFVVDAESGETRQITDGEGDDSAPAWSPDGGRIAFISDRRAHRETDTHSDVYTVSADGGDLTPRSARLSTVAAIAWSPDGDAIAAVGSDDYFAAAGLQSWIFVLRDGHPPKLLTGDSISVAGGSAPLVAAPELRWADDGRILFIADARGRSAIYAVDADNAGAGAVWQSGGLASALTFDANARRAVALATTPESPGDLHLVDLDSGASEKITDFNRDYLTERPPARMEKFSVNRGSVEIESRVFLPPDFDPDRRYPAVLDIHGGPHGVFSDSFSPQQQVLATAGYVVLAVNPRGSSTYGARFMKAVHRDWGGEDYRDIIAALDALCQRDCVDERRLGITGYSYGGFMSAWIIGQDARFGAAVVGAPCINLSSMYGTSDIGVRFGEIHWGGARHEALDAFLERSPLTYAPNVGTPVLLMHGEDDVRCPIEQSEQYFVALKRLGKEAEFVRFPGCSHGFLRTGHPKMREEYLARLLAWMDERIGGNGG